MRLGVHVSIAGKFSLAAERAISLGCTAMQIFSRSPRAWASPALAPEEIRRFKRLRADAAIEPLAVHASYLINLASADPSLRRRSVHALASELDRAAEIGAEYLVVHVGSASGRPVDEGIREVAVSLRETRRSIPHSVTLLLENTAGERGDIGSRLEEIGEILRRVEGNGRIGVCLDTCHLFAAGYDIRNESGVRKLSKAIRETIGFDRVGLIHLNDSKKGLGCRVDRHEHIGKGKIGLKGFRALVRHSRLGRIPLILETPKDSDGADRVNLKTVRSLKAKER